MIELHVRPLEWSELLPGIWRASTICGGRYEIYETADGRHYHAQIFWSSAYYDSEHATLNEAKAAAQADYEARIRSALEVSQ